MSQGHHQCVDNSESKSDVPSQSSDSIGMDPREEQRVYDLARTQTGISLSSTVRSGGLENPFLGSSSPQLDPTSDKFNLKSWLQALMRLPKSLNGEPARNLGFTFRSLSAYGYGTPTDYQKNFVNVFLDAPALVRGLFGIAHKTKIQILEDFEGLLNSGEMLVVLGRPGSGCSTLLKTLSGQIDGFVIDQKTILNYQGTHKFLFHPPQNSILI